MDPLQWMGAVRIISQTTDLKQLFVLSFWRHPFTADDQLVRKWRSSQEDASNHIAALQHPSIVVKSL